MDQQIGKYQDGYDKLEIVLASDAKALDADFDSAAKSDRLLMIISILVGGLVLVVLTQVVSTSITGQLGMELREATALAHSIAAGDLTSKLTHDPKNPASLASAFEHMQAVLGQFQTAQTEMARQHDAGMLDFRMPLGDLPGSSRTMADSTNQLLNSHIGVKMKVVEVVTAYTEGRLDVVMDRLPARRRGSRSRSIRCRRP